MYSLNTAVTSCLSVTGSGILAVIVVIFITSKHVVSSDAGLVCAHPAGKSVQLSHVHGFEVIPVKGRMHAVVLFGRFKEEPALAGSAVPDFAADLFDPNLPGSVTHFYNEMSRGQYELTGSVFPREYAAKRSASSYLSGADGEPGGFAAYVAELLIASDINVDYSQYDNNGPDGLPNSGDDDGVVDFLFVVARSTPQRFIISGATGVASLGLEMPFRTNDRSIDGGFIMIESGVIQQGRTMAEAVGSMCHEFAHSLGLPDLFDTDINREGSAIDPAYDSAGIGYWGLMAHGARGWDDGGGPNPFCAWSLAQLGWLGVANSQLKRVAVDTEQFEFTDVNAGGNVAVIVKNVTSYLMVEHRSRSHSYYERNLPTEGLLIWEVDDSGINSDERRKRVDLVSADGLYFDAGFPHGQEKGFDSGRDNLDFWSHDDSYNSEFGGNLGDATDVFDGVRYTEYSAVSNPAAPRRISVTDIRREGEVMVANLQLNDTRRAGTIVEDELWSGTISVVGDVVIAPGVTLGIMGETTVQVENDHRRGGSDPERCEIVVLGAMRNISGGPIVITSAASLPAPGDWYGISLGPFSDLILRDTAINYAYCGLTGTELRQEVLLRGVSIDHTADRSIDFNVVAGKVFLDRVKVSNAGGDGIVVSGPAPLRITDSRIEASAGNGLVRTQGPVEIIDSEFVHYGLSMDNAANVVLKTGTQGHLSHNVFTGGIGILGTGAEGVLIEQNRFEGHHIAIVSNSADLTIVDNVFVDNDLVLQVSGFRVPTRLELNAVQESAHFIANETKIELIADNNWWGSDDDDWISARMAGPVAWRPSLNFDPRTPVSFDLAQNYPNPFNSTTIIDFTVGIAHASLSEKSEMTLEVRTMTGGLVRRLVNVPAAPGIYRAVWDGTDESGHPASSGVYYYQLKVGVLLLREKMTLIR